MYNRLICKIKLAQLVYCFCALWPTGLPLGQNKMHTTSYVNAIKDSHWKASYINGISNKVHNILLWFYMVLSSCPFTKPRFYRQWIIHLPYNAAHRQFNWDCMPITWLHMHLYFLLQYRPWQHIMLRTVGISQISQQKFSKSHHSYHIA